MTAANLVVEELIKGQKMTTELRALLHDDDGPQILGALLDGISASFSRAIMHVQSNASMVDDEQEERPRSSSKGNLIQDSPRPARGYKRRTRLSEGSKVFIASSLDDGYSWRKYGQKDIFTATYPRCYFRCRHKYDQHCQATRQVQRWEQDPSKLEVTYIGNHTCDQQPPLDSSMPSAAAASINSECFDDHATGDETSRVCLGTERSHHPAAMSTGELPHAEETYDEAASHTDDEIYSTLQPIEGCHINAGITSGRGTGDVDALWGSS